MTISSARKNGLLTATHPPGEESLGSTAANSRFLHAGQIYVSTQHESIVFILGSCVAVCLWDSMSGIGGATHFLLPSWDGRGTSSPRYGNVAITSLLQKLVDAGAQRDQLRAKVFGGGCLFDIMREGHLNHDHLGRRNVEMAKDILTKERVPIVATDVGGDRGKRITFRTDNGETMVKEL